MKIKNKKDFILGVASILISIWIYYLCSIMVYPKKSGDPGSTMFPLIGAAIMFICGVVLIIKPGQAGKKFMTKDQWKAAGVIFSIYVLFTVLLWLVGFMITVPIITFILTYLMSAQSRPNDSKKKRLIQSIIYAIIAGALIYVIYVIGLQAKLPKGLLFNLFK